MTNATNGLQLVVEYIGLNTHRRRIARPFLALLAAIALLFGAEAAAADADKIVDTGHPVSIPPNTELEVVHGKSVVIASHRQNGRRIELSITVMSDDDPLRTRVALVDGQRFTITVGGEDQAETVTRYRFRRTGRSVELVLLSGDGPIETTLELSSLLQGPNGTGRPARQKAVVRAALRR